MLGNKNDKNLGFERKNRFEILKKTAKIFEELKKKKIELNFQNREQHSDVSRNRNDGSYRINQGMMVKNGISPKTRLERCLGHIAFDSPTTSFSKNIKPGLLTKIPNEYSNQASRMLEQIFDTFEDRRTESNYGMLYKGALERFREARQVDAKAKWEDGTPTPVDPITAIQMAGLDQYTAVRNSDYSDAIDWLKLVEHTGKRGALMLTKKFWNEVGEKWFLDYIDQIQQQEESEQGGDGEGQPNDQDGNQPQQTPQNQQGQQSPDGDQDEQDESDEQDEQDEDSESEKGQPDGSGNQNPSKSKSSEEMKDDLSQAINDMEYQSNSDHDRFEEDEEIEEDDIGSSLEAELNAGEEEIEEMEEAIANMKPEVEKPKYNYDKDFKDHIGVRDRGEVNAYYKVDTVVARKLSKAFRKIKGNDVAELDTYGMDIDVDAYIDRKIKGYGDFLTTDKNITGFDIVIGVDESGSMGGHKIQIVRDMTATLYKALEMTPQVKLKIVGWQSGGSNCEIHEVTKLSEVSQIEAYGGTPLALGTWHCKQVIDKMQGARKVFFQITDGEPNSWSDVEKAKEAVKLMRKKGVMCFGIFIGHHSNGAENMKTIFGKESYLACNTVEEVSSFLTKELTKKVLRHLARAC